MKNCKNCGNHLHDLFCSHCGQKAIIGRITWSYVWQDIFHFFTHIERGFIFTSFHLIYDPGKTIRNFIDGKRKTYQSPISYFLIWTTIFIFFLYWMEKVFGENSVIDYKEYFGPTAATKFAISHLSFVLTIIIPFQALYLYILVTGNSYNYFETMTATIYALGTIILFQFIFAVIALLFHIMGGSSLDLRISDSFKILYLIWFIFDTIKLFPVRLKSLKAIFFLILAFGTFTLWRLYGFPLLIRWLT